MSVNKILDRDINQIQKKIEEMIKETKNQYASAYEVMHTNNTELASTIVAHDKHINDLQNDFIATALWKMAKQKMFARDLRLAVGSILIAREIEIIADYAKWICSFFVKYKPTPDERDAIAAMFQLVIKMLNLVSNLIDNFDLDQEAKVITLNQELNNKFKKLNLTLLKKVKNIEDEKHGLTILAEIRQINNLERAGDHLLNIQEILTFIRSGQFEEFNKIASI